ncbi:helix-turn-helix domain-containing protein [Granulicatella sp. zg-ZJ]|nr:helix-turn-helix transcriptional regulator [Carnobacteriaceae bacterium zg-ZUI78]NEW62464.1 helix-turn-helix domain-containing protein [Granulicatella sp. zg-ZJ]NEW65746.1 helix-turn-helix domain-containing protein [Granulicatella sp. zg-84]QMI86648.1 helix-turn-helix transcriptional regulator [Carnobacteriaceae bacterium zg-84]NEW62466.1 helix-turn-helix domain-containing protein [Granulicatella sp. zg-ZJ]
MVLSLKAARANANLTLIEASKILSINKDTLSRYERNSSHIPRSISLKMQELYQIPEKNLFFGDITEFHKKKQKHIQTMIQENEF